jgi:hypothetical protein
MKSAFLFYIGQTGFQTRAREVFTMRPIIRLLMVFALFLGTSNVRLFAQGFRGARMWGFPSNVIYYFGFPPGGNFAHAAFGSFIPSTGSFVPSLTGSSLLTGRGFFMPTNGTFVPSPFGNFVLTTREAFNPATKTFVPSATGNFVLSTRGDLVSSTTKTPVDSFVPLTPPTGMNAFVNPYAATQFNPYMAATSVAAPYPIMPYGSSYAAPYSSPYGNAASNTYVPTANVQSPPETAGEKQTRLALGAHGIPVKDGHISWPLAFRLLPPDKKRELTDTLESQLVALASEGYTPAVLQGAKQSVQRLSAWLSAHQTDLADATYQEGIHFLQRIEGTLSALKN